MKHRIDYFSGLNWGGIIGGIIGSVSCTITVTESGGSGGNATWQGIATLLVLAIIGAAMSLPVVYFLNYEYNNGKVEINARKRLDYYESVWSGAVIGAILGIMVCNFACISNNGDYENVSGGYWGAFIIMAIIGAVIAPVIAYFYNKETDKINEEAHRKQEKEIEEARRRREKEIEEARRKQVYIEECKNIKDQISKAIKQTVQNNLFSDIIKCMERHKNNLEYLKVVNTEVSHYEGIIYENTIDALLLGNIRAANSGLLILSETCASHSQYQTAFSRLRDKKLMLALMEQNGLPFSSPLMKRFSFMFNEMISC